MVGAMEPYWELHCIVFVLSQLVSASPRLERTGYETGECSRANLNRYTFDIFFTLISNALEPSKTLLLLSQPHRFCSHSRLLYFVWSTSKQKKSL